MRRLAHALAGLAVVGTVLIAAPAQAATYGVSMYYSAPKADVGQTIKISGVVAGSSSTYKTLTVQRKVGSAAWTTVGTVKTGGNSKYYFFHKVSAVGDQQFRVIAPKSGSTSQGVSTPKGFTGWTWLWMTDQPMFTQGSSFIGSSPLIQGATRYRSIEVGQSSTIVWSTGNSCDTSDFRITQYDGSSGTSALQVATNDGSQSHDAVSGSFTDANHVTTSTEYVNVSRGSSGGTIVIVSPRVHCKVARLGGVLF